ncbi:hypothetical protein V473_02745 [Sphingobium cupriresistens LL01]|uniref:Uncharacterized protein n=1 Tax=Sphingobium cupriresistens LL01 TaxID=1420583 RepID=A0A0J7Y5N8_9SPHN|nr:hypothetical protein V473_02745 [Sphingobium cupriresistens LL01]
MRFATGVGKSAFAMPRSASRRRRQSASEPFY